MTPTQSSSGDTPNPTETLLVTGGSGFLASHVVRELLRQGYSVLVTVRSEAMAKKVLQAHAQYSNRLSFILVPDMTVPGAYDAAVQGVTGVFHISSPCTFTSPDNVNDLLIPAVSGTRGILESIKKHGPYVKRVVLTSSAGAIVDPIVGFDRIHPYTEGDWTKVTWDEAANGSGNLGYIGSKQFAEKTAWDFIQNEKPSFDLVTICPTFIIGPIIIPTQNMRANPSFISLYKLLDGKLDNLGKVLLPAYVDVRDSAKAHVRAYEEANASNQRYLISSGSLNLQQVADIMKKHFHSLVGRLPVGRTEERGVLIMDSSKAVRDLGFAPRGPDETVVDTVRRLLEIEATGY
ncbi:3-beta hydroxysteroid dehydrogenase/isomerase [Penicillium concentricum]|uniref:3-beta hydroxysteroid dehydrogenase/isomerase n=1 Tax=Penicillium concentricum TaxID=293559 RepID=A0A9W9RB92_9EURO|nr:3-beta hydroxysteroid dehydrogenase/isomerase [Penicillium concentricum]KAJ5356973.1 3-beta hydroxysteroid dehydrogenase/isomerase [Penicillium concentricum]